jgi:hypothetical protein
MKFRNQPHEPGTINVEQLFAAKRCGARNRAGNPCQAPALKGRARCRLHGGLSTGAPKGNANGNYHDGHFTKEAKEERRWAKRLVKQFGVQSK